MKPADVTVELDVDAPADEVWPLVSDPDNYPRWSPEATGTRRVQGSGLWRVGDVFIGANRARLPWVTRCEVIAADPTARVFAFDVDFGPLPVARWQYEVREREGGSTVVESWWDRRRGAPRPLIDMAGRLLGRGRSAVEHNRSTMAATLAALKDQAEAGEPPADGGPAAGSGDGR